MLLFRLIQCSLPSGPLSFCLKFMRSSGSYVLPALPLWKILICQIVVTLPRCAFPISRGPFCPNESRKRPIVCPLRRDMGVFLEFGVRPKFCLRSRCAGRNIVLYCTTIYRESIVSRYTWPFYIKSHQPVFLICLSQRFDPVLDCFTAHEATCRRCFMYRLNQLRKSWS